MALEGLRSNIKVTVVGQCAICDQVTTLRCQACLKGGKDAEDVPFYCSRQHQSKHWKNGHKSNCGQLAKGSLGWKSEQGPCPLRMSQNVPEGISYFVATKDLEPGHVLFQRKPLLAFPSLPFDKDFYQFLSRMPQFKDKVLTSPERLVWTCVGCYEILIYGEVIQAPGHGLLVHKCLTCGWPVHSNVHPKHGLSRCQFVHQDECKVLMDRGLTWEKLRNEGMYSDAEYYYHLGLLRAVLLQPELKDELMKLPVFAPNYYAFDLKRTIPFVRDRCGMGNNVGEEEAHKIMLIIFGNVLGPSMQHTSPTNKLAFIIYQGGPTGRIMTHDCTPNCSPYIAKDLTATFKTTRKVDDGQLLTINYITISNCMPVNERLIMCAQMLMEPCACRRCRSSTEDGTCFSAIKCPADKRSGDGKGNCQYLLPMPKPNHTVLSDVFLWKCGCNACTYYTEQSAVEKLVSTIKSQVEAAAMSPNAYEELKSLLFKNADKTVHPNHAIMLYAKLNIAAVATSKIKNVEANKDPKFAFNLHKKYLADFDAVLEHIHEVQPGRSAEYGLFLFFQTLMRMSQLAERVLAPESKPSHEDLEDELSSILLALKEAWLVLNDNPMVEPYDTALENRLRKFYANHLLASILNGMGEDSSEKISSVKMLKDKFYSAVPVSLEMSAEEIEYRQIMIIKETVPNLIKKLEEHGVF